MAFSLYFWPSPYTVGLLPILLAYFLCWWPSLYDKLVGLLPIQLALLPIHWPSPYTVGRLPILLAFSLYSILLTFYLHVYCQPYPYTVGLLPILLVFSLYYSYTVGLLPILLTLLPIWLTLSLYSWPSPYAVGFLPILLAFSLYCWPFYLHVYCRTSPYNISYTVGLLPILLAFSLYEPLSIVHLCSISVPLFTMCIADLWDTHTTHVHGHFAHSVTVWTLNVVALLVVMHIFTKCLHHVHTTHADVELCSVCFKHGHTHQCCPHIYLYTVVHTCTSTYIRYK